MIYNYNTLNLLKGIGILMIILVHNRHFVLQGDLGYWNLVNFGQMGCQIFFLASGFGLMASRDKNKSSFDKYILKRLRRLWPGYAGAILVSFLLNILFLKYLDQTPGFVMNMDIKGLALNLLLLHGISPQYINSVCPAGWYMGTAMLLYILFPLMAKLMEDVYERLKGGTLMIPLIFWLINRCIQALVYEVSAGELYPYNNSFMYYLFVNQLPVFLLGIELYLDVKAGEHRKQPWGIIVGAGCAMIAACIYLFMQPVETDAGYRFTYIPTIMGCGVYCLGLGMLGLEELQGIGDGKVGSWIGNCGKHSYGMYLVHPLLSWYGLRAFTNYLLAREINYNDRLLYLLVYPIAVALTYWLGCIIDRGLKKI